MLWVVRILIIVLMLVPVGVHAQNPAGLPAEYRLQGLDMLWQQYNRCSATALYRSLAREWWTIRSRAHLDTDLGNPMLERFW
jgi:hypothetical protein